MVCRPISVEDNVVTLGFPEDKAFLREVGGAAPPVLEEGIAAVLGRPVAVRCVATNIDLVPELPVGRGGRAGSSPRPAGSSADERADAAEVG